MEVFSQECISRSELWNLKSNCERSVLKAVILVVEIIE